MTQFKNGERVRVIEGELEGIEGFVMVSGPTVTSVRMHLLSGEVAVPIYTGMLVSADEPHDALTKMKSLYPDFLTSKSYRFRLTLHLNGLNYVSDPIDSLSLEYALQEPPAGLTSLEFMLKQDDPNRGLAWKLLWTE